MCKRWCFTCEMLGRARTGFVLLTATTLVFCYFLLRHTQVLHVQHKRWHSRERMRCVHSGTSNNTKLGTTMETSRGTGHCRTDCDIFVGERPPCITRNISSTGPWCHEMRRKRGNTKVKVNLDSRSMEMLEKLHGADLEPGGLFRPTECTSSQRVAVIVPFRERSLHLKIFLNNIHPFLKKQRVEYMILVVEQAPGSRLNRGMLRNIGVVEGEKLCKFDCYFFHDIDMIPLSERNLYTCGSKPRHHAAALARWNYALPYEHIFGGVVSFKTDLFKKINGYSNMYFGWGGEDDDLYNRVKHHNMDIERYPMKISGYGDLKHRKSEAQNARYSYLKTWKARVEVDGLNSLKYHRYLVEFRRLYTWIYVGIKEPEVLGSYLKK
ncbi:beta-1,4-N-acetylgalactosaminyltransferase bre-4-like [Haliotis rufescens]|uniref:beta-1,4-N-acetylgalactosaminyltransferase bre-4-like n=1 Tax=Haliotis rufescens TaxID=6454 RepID=UPI00201F550A|nr:beta-1,4-N-acetylgalactosaminyltransferase bre-4-like [Haliotis rufescens]